MQIHNTFIHHYCFISETTMNSKKCELKRSMKSCSCVFSIFQRLSNTNLQQKDVNVANIAIFVSLSFMTVRTHIDCDSTKTFAESSSTLRANIRDTLGLEIYCIEVDTEYCLDNSSIFFENAVSLKVCHIYPSRSSMKTRGFTSNT